MLGVISAVFAGLLARPEVAQPRARQRIVRMTLQDPLQKSPGLGLLAALAEQEGEITHRRYVFGIDLQDSPQILLGLVIRSQGHLDDGSEVQHVRVIGEDPDRRLHPFPGLGSASAAPGCELREGARAGRWEPGR